jgi:hypothetical protein
MRVRTRAASSNPLQLQAVERERLIDRHREAPRATHDHCARGGAPRPIRRRPSPGRPQPLRPQPTNPSPPVVLDAPWPSSPNKIPIRINEATQEGEGKTSDTHDNGEAEDCRLSEATSPGSCALSIRGSSGGRCGVPRFDESALSVTWTILRFSSHISPPSTLLPRTYPTPGYRNHRQGPYVGVAWPLGSRRTG